MVKSVLEQATHRVDDAVAAPAAAIGDDCLYSRIREHCQYVLSALRVGSSKISPPIEGVLGPSHLQAKVRHSNVDSHFIGRNINWQVAGR